jgi:hypothetical protein
VKFHVTANEQNSQEIQKKNKKKRNIVWIEVGTESGCSRRVLNVGKAYSMELCSAVGAVK